MKGEMGDVAEDEAALALGSNGEALMAGSMARRRDDGDFVGEIEVTLHQPEVVQLLEELADDLRLVKNFYGWWVGVFNGLGFRKVRVGRSLLRFRFSVRRRVGIVGPSRPWG